VCRTVEEGNKQLKTCYRYMVEYDVVTLLVDHLVAVYCCGIIKLVVSIIKTQLNQFLFMNRFSPITLVKLFSTANGANSFSK
jgi:hypothetical protein